jgi:5-(carboxyamino)imidazole ribonucleotide synthase
MLGGGQLGRYALMAAASMGYRTMVVDPDPSAPAATVAGEHLVTSYDAPASLHRLADECDVVTIEFENPPAAALDELSIGTIVAPGPETVRIAQDRILEKRFLEENGFPVGPYEVLASDRGLATWPSVAAASSVGAGSPVGDRPAIVKTARLGYDGKGQRRVDGVAEIHAAHAELGGVTCVVEALLELEVELSVLVARTADGRAESWAVAENHHVDGILDLTIVPARVDPVLADRATGLGMAIADALGFVGVLAIEMFVVGGEVLVNELAPRPHNSGHWTLDACATSQFEQQIRAVCGLGLGKTVMTAPAIAMVNLLGDRWDVGEPRWERVLDDPDVKLHLYDKTEPRPGRKMGHLTVTSDVTSAAAARALELRERLMPSR